MFCVCVCVCVCLHSVEKLLSMCSSSCLPGGGSNMELALHCLHYCQGNTMVCLSYIILSVYIFFIYSFTFHSFHHFHHASIHYYSPASTITHSLILFVIYSSFFSFIFSYFPSESLHASSVIPPPDVFLSLFHPSLLCRPHWRCCCSHNLHQLETTTTPVTLDLSFHPNS